MKPIEHVHIKGQVFPQITLQVHVWRKQVFLQIEARLVFPVYERKQTGCISGDLYLMR